MPPKPAVPGIVDVPCSVPHLLTAIRAANGTAAPETLRLAPGCTYRLTAGANPFHPVNGLPVVTGTLTVDGQGATITRAATAPRFRILLVARTGRLTMYDTTISGGSATDCPAYPDVPGMACGGGIANLGQMFLTRSRVTGNRAESKLYAQGAGIDNPGNATVRSSVVSGNTVAYSGSDRGGAAAGGGIANDGPLTVEGAQVINNVAWAREGTRSFAFGSGLAGMAQSTVKNSVVRNNRSSAPGGFARAAVTNSAPAASGGMTVTGSFVRGNVADAPDGTAQGGGITNSASMTVDNTHISGNTVTAQGGTARGGGIRLGPGSQLKLLRSSVVGNVVDAAEGVAQGGGVDNPDGGTLASTGARILNNTVTAQDGTALGGGLYHAVGTSTLDRTVINGTRAIDGGGIFRRSGTVRLLGSQVMFNTPNNCRPTDSVRGCVG
ncbi:hypothetical protein QRN89_14130 [Streptomyces chengbuensis]|uniref:hypothetical protein n=1 Tax=Streptomyces TaxID=1883 RepID=UPI0025B3E3E6|nr:hypothetical protein [Streptomyces sp. HUAS CB01]WJY50844.1 hypothetical protein QRN89_14130 [Streptomyces sp. HUAS CB01]